MLQVSGYSQLTSTCREFFKGFSCRFMGGSGLTVEEDKETPFSFQRELWYKVIPASDPTSTFDRLESGGRLLNFSGHPAGRHEAPLLLPVLTRVSAPVAPSSLAEPERGSESFSSLHEPMSPGEEPPLRLAQEKFRRHNKTLTSWRGGEGPPSLCSVRLWAPNST